MHANSKTFYLHGGYVRSLSDGDQHYIPAAELARLYGLPPSHEQVRLISNVDQMRTHVCGVGCVHLYPRANGNYDLNEN